MYTVYSHPELPWDWGYLSQNPNITPQDVFDNADKPWHWRWLSENRYGIPEKDTFQWKRCTQQTQAFKAELICAVLLRL
jgi:hypothetical protein